MLLKVFLNLLKTKKWRYYCNSPHSPWFILTGIQEPITRSTHVCLYYGRKNVASDFLTLADKTVVLKGQEKSNIDSLLSSSHSEVQYN